MLLALMTNLFYSNTYFHSPTLVLAWASTTTHPPGFLCPSPTFPALLCLWNPLLQLSLKDWEFLEFSSWTNTLLMLYTFPILYFSLWLCFQISNFSFDFSLKLQMLMILWKLHLDVSKDLKHIFRTRYSFPHAPIPQTQCSLPQSMKSASICIVSKSGAQSFSPSPTQTYHHFF